MKRFIGVIAIILILAGLCIGEEIFVRKTINRLHHTSYHIEELVKENKDNIDCDRIHEEFDYIDSYWDKAEQVLCYIVNFEKIKPINETLSKLNGAISENDYSLAIENIKTLQNYSENLKYIMGASITNFL